MKTFTSSDYYDIIDDINRVELKCNQLKQMIQNVMGITLSITIKTNWTRTDIPTVEHMERIRSNIQTIARCIQASYSINTFGNKFNYKNANDFEIALNDVQEYFDRVNRIISQPIAGFYYSNEPNLLSAERN